MGVIKYNTKKKMNTKLLLFLLTVLLVAMIYLASAKTSETSFYELEEDSEFTDFMDYIHNKGGVKKPNCKVYGRWCNPSCVQYARYAGPCVKYKCYGTCNFPKKY